MPQPRKIEQATRMYALYQDGLSLAQVAKAFGVSRQSVYDMFHRRTWALRAKVLLPTVVYDGISYSQDPYGYYRQTNGDRDWLHQVVWKQHFGPIPSDYEIHHRDHDKTNNAPGNLACLSPTEHAQLHQLYQPIADQYCQFCGTVFTRKRQPSGRLETPAEVARRKYCDGRCHGKAMRGQPRGSV